MSDTHSQLFNLVILPTTSHTAGDQRFLLSATRVDRQLRLVSPEWSEGEVRRALASIDASNLQTEQLFRGNRMAAGGRDGRYLYFTGEKLERIGLAPVA